MAPKTVPWTHAENSYFSQTSNPQALKNNSLLNATCIKNLKLNNIALF